MSGRSGKFIQTLTIDATMQVDGIKRAISELESAFKGMNIGKDMEKTMAALKTNLENFAQVASKEIKDVAGAKEFEHSWQKVESSLDGVAAKLKAMGMNPDKLIPKETFTKIANLQKKITDFQAESQRKDTSLKYLNEELKKAEAESERLKAELQSLAKVGENNELIPLKYTKEGLEQAKRAVDEIQAKIDRMSAARKMSPKNAEKEYGYKADEFSSLPRQIKEQRKALSEAEAALAKYENGYNNLNQVIEKTKQELAVSDKQIEHFKNTIKLVNKEFNGKWGTDALKKIKQELSELTGKDLKNTKISGLKKIVDELAASESEKLKPAIDKVKAALEGCEKALGDVTGESRKWFDGIKDGFNNAQDFSKQVEALTNQVTQFFSLTNGWNLLRRAIRSAVDVVKELDEAMTGIAVVSKYDLSDIWGKRGDFSDQATEIGVSTLDLVQATTLYTQQGLELDEAMKVATETMKMGRIANLEGEEATNLMTAALRGYNMELTEASHVNDVYSNLAAKTASNQEQLATAMSRTASIAYNSGASFENMSAFLAQIIETTQEAPETAGTAMKTIIARFQELKKPLDEIGEVEGEVVDANKIETALRQAGVALRDVNGEFRDFDDVILELSSKWDGLDKMTQRYIATMAAGSRQQSRFIALLNNNERLVELTGYAANSAGKSQEQFNKTLDSFQSKLAKLHNEMDQFYTNLMNNNIIKLGMDIATGLLHILNEIITPLSNSENLVANFAGALIELGIVAIAFRGALILLQKGATKAAEGMTKFTLSNLLSVVGLKKNTKATKENTAVKTKNITATELELTAEEALLVANGLASESELLEAKAEVLSAKAAEEEAAATAGATVAKKAYTLETIKQTIAESAFLKTLLAIIGPLAAIIAALGAFALIIKSVDDAHFTQEEQMKSYQKSIDDTNNSLQSLQEQEEAVATSLKNIEDGRKSLDQLVEGTSEWYEQLRNTNQEILNLIDKIPALAQYLQFLGNGNFDLLPEGYDFIAKYQEDLKKQEDIAGRSLIRQQRDLKTVEVEKENEKYREDAITALREVVKPAAQPGGEKNPHYSHAVLEDILDGKVEIDLPDEAKAIIEQYNTQLLASTKQLESWNNQLGETYGEDRFDQIVGAIIEEDTSELSKAMSQLISEGEANIPGIFAQSSYGLYSSSELNTSGGRLANKNDFLKTYAQELEIEDVDKLKVDTIEGIREIYTKATGLAADSEATYEDLFKILANNYVEFRQEQAEHFEDLSEKEKAAVVNYKDLMTGALEDMSEEDIRILENMDDKIQEQLKIASDAEIRNVIETQKEKNKAAKKQKRLTDQGNLIDSMMISGLNFDPSIITENRYAPHLENLNSIISKDIFSQENKQLILDVLPELNNEKLNYLINEITNIPFDNPIQGYEQLQKLALDADVSVQKVGESLLANENATWSFENQLDQLVNREEDLNKELDELIEKNGKLSRSDVKSLSKSYSSLSTFMKNASINATTMAKALGLIKSGKLNVDNLTNAVIKSMAEMNSLDELIQQTADDIANFDLGTDTGMASDFITKNTKTISELFENGEYGNPQIANFINHIFGPDFLNAAETGEQRIALMRQAIQALQQVTEEDGTYNWWKKLAEETTLLGEPIENLDEYLWKVKETAEGGIELNIDNFEGGTDQLVAELAKAYNVTTETARLMLTDFSNYSSDLAMELADRDYAAGIQAYAEALTNSSGDIIVTWQQIEAEAALSGQTTDQIVSDLHEMAGSHKVKIITSLNDQGHIVDLAATIKELIGGGGGNRGLSESGTIEMPALDINNYIKDRTVNLDQLNLDLSKAGFNEAEIEQLVNGILQQIQGQFDQVQSGGLTLPKDSITTEAGTINYKPALDDMAEQVRMQKFGEILATEMESVKPKIQPKLDPVTMNGVKEEVRSSIEDTNYNVHTQLATDVGGQVQRSIDNKTYTMNVTPIVDKGKLSFTMRVTSHFDPTTGKDGTIEVTTQAEGTPNAKTNFLALVGEGGGPELIQTKNGAYLAGLQGPEMAQIHKGDTVYSFEQTKEIFKRGGYHIPGFKNGWNVPRYATAWNDRGNGGDDSTTDNTDAVDANTEATKENTEKWENSIDFLTRQVSRLEAYTNKRELLEKERDNLIERGNVGWRDLVRYQDEIVKTLKLEIGQRKENLERSRKELQDIRVKAGDDTFNGQSIRQFVDYIEGQGLLYNKEMVDAFIKKYEGTDQEEDAKAFYERIQDYISQFENVGGKIDENLKGIREGEAELIKAEQEFKDAALEMEERITDAIVNERQKQIDDLSNNYEAINTANDNLLDALQQGIEDMRAQREQEKAAADLQKSERQLALMSMDTSGANRLDILKAQESLDNQRQSYTDSLIDKSIEQMTRDNEKAAQQREQQIALMEAQLQYDIDNGVIAAQADQLLHAMEKGDQHFTEKVETLLKNLDEYNSKGQLNRQEWMTDLGNQISQSIAYLKGDSNVNAAVTGFAGSNGQNDSAKYNTDASNTRLSTSFYTTAENTKVDAVNAKLDPLFKKYSGKFKPAGGLNNDEEVIARGIYGSWWAGGSGWNAERIAQKFGDRIAARVMAIRQSFLDKKTDPKNWPMPVSEFHKFKYDQFATGGLADFTGPAWLDGTKSKPEYVLNADQTQRFFDLLDFTKDIGNDNNSTLIGDTYYNISMSNEIASDYDVDNMWDEMQRKIYENAAYRNVQSLNFGRR